MSTNITPNSSNNVTVLTNTVSVTTTTDNSKVVTIVTPGPQGPRGLQGPQGPSGSSDSVESSSFATTAQTSSNSTITHGVTDNNQYLITIPNSTDTVQPIQRPTAPILYSPSTTNPITNASDKAAEFQLGLNNQAGGIFLTSNLLSDNPNYIRTLNQDLYFKVKNTGAGKLFISASAGIETTGDITASGDITTNALTAAGLIYPTTDGTDGQVIVTDGAGNLSFGHGEKLHLQVRNDDSVDITAGTPIYSTGEIGGSERIKVRIAQASDASKMPAIGIVETTLTTAGDTKDGFAIINGIYNTNITPVSGTPALGDNVYVHADGGVTTIKPSGSNLIQNIGTVLKTNGTVIQGMKVSSIDRTNDVPNLLDNTIFFGSGSDQTQQIHISGALDSTVINNITASGDISASNFIGDGSDLTNLQRPISASVQTNLTASNTNSGFFFEVGGLVTCSIQTVASVTCDVGNEYEFFQTGSGNFLFETASGVTMYSKSGLKLNGEFAACTLKHIKTNTWVLIGDMTT